MTWLYRCLVAFFAFGAFDAAAAGVQRSFVASYGQAANTAANCGLATPCRALNEALGVTSAGGEIVVLDSAGYSAATIAQTVTIVAPRGVYAGITAFAGNAILINAPGAIVRLRGLTLNGLGGTNGISATHVALLDVEGADIRGFSGNGVDFTAAGGRLNITDTSFSGNGVGVYVLPASSVATVTIARSHFHDNAASGAVLSTNATGMVTTSDFADNGDNVVIDAGSIATISDCTVSNRVYGIGIHVNGESIALVTRSVVSGSYDGITATSGGYAQVSDSAVHGTTVGMSAEEDSGAFAALDIERSTVIDSYTGLYSRGTVGFSRIRVSNSTVTLNYNGFNIYTATSFGQTRQNNTVSGNSNDYVGAMPTVFNPE